MSTPSESLLSEFAEYVSVVRRLRLECPWDREQTHQSLKYHLLEEAYEAAEAIDHDQLPLLRDELGDLLLHVTLHAVIAEESAAFSLEEVLRRNREKLIRRHPHVFADRVFADAEEVKKNWERTKMAEGRQSVTDGLPHALPSLIRAQRLQDKVAKVGFDWPDKEDVWKKVEEEMQELHEAGARGDKAHVEEEFGDLLFALVNYARFLHVHSEEALRKATEKFTARFRAVEEELSRAGKTPEEAGLAEMDRIWEMVKRRDRAS
ncbi:MAG: nucleoside triphosphate pyrophosphohydrolase [Bacteroidetes bacterium]|jgi:MazG family protein|nr:nucleoside triphosphate pyrophosphohydrolase [Bacteroidota bacterium]